MATKEIVTQIVNQTAPQLGLTAVEQEAYAFLVSSHLSDQVPTSKQLEEESSYRDKMYDRGVSYDLYDLFERIIGANLSYALMDAGAIFPEHDSDNVDWSGFNVDGVDVSELRDKVFRFREYGGD